MVDIYNIEIVLLKGDLLNIKVSCGSGTYIRSLAYDIGNLLGVGASVKKLERTGIGDYKLKDSIGIEEFCRKDFRESDLESSPFIISVEKLLEKNGDIYIKDEFKSRIKNGSPVKGNMIEDRGAMAFNSFNPGCLLKVRDGNGDLLAVHKILSKNISADLEVGSLKLTKSIIIF